MLTNKSPLPDPGDTIVALSSASGIGARAIIRLSGPRAFAITATLGVDHLTTDGRFQCTALQMERFHSPIPADVYHFSRPRTPTGDDVVEIHTFAATPIVEAIIAACLNAGARAARPGEFTMRAFLAGKLDLTRAEAVLGVIDAGDQAELKQALAQLAGGLANPLQELRGELLDLLADVEAALDFADEDIQFVSSESLLKRLAKGLAYLTLLRKQIDQRALAQRHFRAVIMGPPNAGKSSLFNALVGVDAALVSTEPGTTRDYLSTMLESDGIDIELVDTAGLQAAIDGIDQSAQNLGQAQGARADLILWCGACDQPDLDPHEAPESGERWRIATKADLAPAPPGAHATSAATGEGIAELRSRLSELVRRSGHASLAPSLSRCRHHVETSLELLRSAHRLVLDGGQPELLALELRLTLDELGAMVGAVYTDDLLDRVFSRFCIGK